jgi:hypothetical protein
MVFDLPGFILSLKHTFVEASLPDGRLTYRLNSAQSAFAAGAMLLRTTNFKPGVAGNPRMVAGDGP